MYDAPKCTLQTLQLVGFDPSIVSQIGRFLVRVLLSRSVRSPFVGFVSVMDKSFVKRR